MIILNNQEMSLPKGGQVMSEGSSRVGSAMSAADAESVIRICTFLGKLLGILKFGEGICISRTTSNAQLRDCSRIVHPPAHENNESTFNAFGRMRRNEDSFERMSLPFVTRHSVSRPSTT